ncbi:hypothetical protein COT51_00250 [candidate division WWE3 bacterium CG08_land_8_20_14_0_20_41_15]|uniref:CopG family transcriptional regulator n=1 Tax=candidate division WWE3 bacterium CG08_land_8_20_14_0_20_41_15 TaxID=1975086 RepID=A0A2H0XAJ6_UNCKA|nr:MAG: hypothetical protein COT51_00250 [candidate division WWE3 bacterium CG08_land_8_20_14_0_20_41_15]
MPTINVSLPVKLKTQAEALVEGGYYSSFGDLLRDSLRRLVEKERYDLWLDEVKLDVKKGTAVILKSTKDVDKYLDKI